MAVTLTRGALGLSVALMIGCAQGYQTGEEPIARGNNLPPLPTGGLGGPSAGARAMSGRGSAGMAAGPSYQGDPCMRGETEPCTCQGDMGATGEGVRFCRADAMSPTEGSFSDCEQCVFEEEEPMAGSGSSAGSSGGRAGSGGRGGSGSSGSAGRSSSGSAGRSGGSTGGGSNGSQPWCIFVPVPLPGLCNW